MRDFSSRPLWKSLAAPAWTEARKIADAAFAAECRCDYREALRLWQRLVTRRRVNPMWSERFAANLITVGRLDEAETVLRAARGKHPNHVGLEVCSGLLAAAREDWKTAVDILARFYARNPENPAARAHLGRVLQLRAHAAFDATSPPTLLPIDVGHVANEAIRELLLGFESLGDDCEFGMVQRRFGAEPLGLFRWNMTTPTSLLLGLVSRFDGLGDPAHAEVIVDPLSRQYLAIDRRFDFEMHTFVFEGQIDDGRLLDRMCKIMSYLRERLLGDLASARKIFIYKDKDVDPDYVRTLHDTLRTYGPAILLWILPIDAPVAAGFPGRAAGETVEMSDGLFVGFLSEFGSAHGTWNIRFDEWVALCERLARVARRGEIDREPV